MYLTMKVPGISGGWILIYFSNATKRYQKDENAQRGQERLQGAEIFAQEEVIGIIQ